MEFVDRKKELLRLRRSLESDKKRFIVIYGRRRVGKSALVKRVFLKLMTHYEYPHKRAEYRFYTDIQPVHVG